MMRCPECVGYEKAVEDYNEIQISRGRNLVLSKDKKENERLSTLYFSSSST